MNKSVLVKIKETELKIQYDRENGNRKEKTFEIQHRKQNLTKSQLEDSCLYLQDPYWENGGPCPPGNYYLFHRYRSENGKIRERLEFCQTRPRKLIINEDDEGGVEILKKQGYLKFENSADRTNIQIHGGSKSKGCIVIKNPKAFYEIVKEFLKEGHLIKIEVDDYWKTQKGKKEVKRHKI